MSFNQQNQLKVPWDNYSSRLGRGALKQMTPEQKGRLADLVKERITLEGKQVKDSKLYNSLMKGL